MASAAGSSKKICNNTEEIRRILKFVGNFKGVGKIMRCGGEIYFLERGLIRSIEFFRKNIFCSPSFSRQNAIFR